MNRARSIAMLVVVLLNSIAFAQDDSAKREAADRSARSWLALIDQGDYGKSWEEASSIFKSKLSKADWEGALGQVRAPLGPAGDRTLTSSIYRTDLPNAPQGEYVILQYKTEFAGKGSFIETITPMFDTDGKWRVSGYFVKPAE
jgi:hypothetical protein